VATTGAQTGDQTGDPTVRDFVAENASAFFQEGAAAAAYLCSHLPAALG
jgi:hypothetical protein